MNEKNEITAQKYIDIKYPLSERKRINILNLDFKTKNKLICDICLKMRNWEAITHAKEVYCNFCSIADKPNKINNSEREIAEAIKRIKK